MSFTCQKIFQLKTGCPLGKKIIKTNIQNNLFRKDKLILLNLSIGLLINFFIWGIIYYKFQSIENSLVPLYYNIYLALDRSVKQKNYLNYPKWV